VTDTTPYIHSENYLPMGPVNIQLQPTASQNTDQLLNTDKCDLS
jgi:hypothetical protein